MTEKEMLDKLISLGFRLDQFARIAKEFSKAGVTIDQFVKSCKIAEPLEIR